nr:hypothetical protein CFP56_22333 [Quercus suber]
MIGRLCCILSGLWRPQGMDENEWKWFKTGIDSKQTLLRLVVDARCCVMRKDSSHTRFIPSVCVNPRRDAQVVLFHSQEDATLEDD